MLKGEGAGTCVDTYAVHPKMGGALPVSICLCGKYLLDYARRF